MQVNRNQISRNMSSWDYGFREGLVLGVLAHRR